LSKVACRPNVHTLWTTSDFKRLQLEKYNIKLLMFKNFSRYF